MTRIALPEPIFSPRLTAAPEESTTDRAASADEVTVFPLTLATRLDVVGSISHAHSGEDAATTVRPPTRREVREVAAASRRGWCCWCC